MSAASQDTAIRTGLFVRAVIYAVLIFFAVYYLLPLYVMLLLPVKKPLLLRHLLPWVLYRRDEQ